jgi:ATP-dependent Clp protease ATP-binding subunit ClpB
MDMQFTESVTRALSSAVYEAEKRRNTEVTEHHVLLALFQDQTGYFRTLCQALQLDPKPLLLDLEKKMG